MAFVTVDQKQGKGNKGNGFGKMFRTQLSAQDRIARLAKLEEKDTWAKDRTRKNPKQSAKSPGGSSTTSKGTAYCALGDDSSKETDDEHNFVPVGSQVKKTGRTLHYMALSLQTFVGPL